MGEIVASHGESGGVTASDDDDGLFPPKLWAATAAALGSCTKGLEGGRAVQAVQGNAQTPSLDGVGSTCVPEMERASSLSDFKSSKSICAQLRRRGSWRREDDRQAGRKKHSWTSWTPPAQLWR